MWHKLKRVLFINKFIKPSIKAWLLAGNQVKVNFTNTSREEAVLVAFAMIQQLAAHLGMDKRAVLNKMLKMDSGVVKMKKQQEREAKYGKKLK